MGPVSTVPKEKVTEICPDCPTLFGADNDQVKKTMTLSLEKFNKESGLSKHFAMLKFNRALVSVSLLDTDGICRHIKPPSFSSDPVARLCDEGSVLPGVSPPVDQRSRAEANAIHVLSVCLSRWASSHFTM